MNPNTDPMQEMIGKIAGEVWHYLKANGPSTSLKIRTSLGLSNSRLHLALGWLEREGKIEIAEQEQTLKVSLRPEQNV